MIEFVLNPTMPLFKDIIICLRSLGWVKVIERNGKEIRQVRCEHVLPFLGNGFSNVQLVDH